MASNFLYRLKVISKETGENIIPLYAFKPSHHNWRMTDVLHITDLTQTVLNSDNLGNIDVCTTESYCHRALANKTISYFELFIKDAKSEPNRFEARKIAGTILCRNLNGRGLTKVDRGLINMSVEGAPPTVAAVTLYFRQGTLRKDF